MAKETTKHRVGNDMSGVLRFWRSSRTQTERTYAFVQFASAIASLSLMFLTASANARQAVDYRARTIYFLVTDRFHPHTPYNPYVDPAYPDATNKVNCFVVLCTQEKQWRSYWGGDILGIVEKLDYLKRLGISAVWVTPLMENVRAYESGTGYGTGYHGYWVQNYYRVNPHFGDWDKVNLLSRKLHARGMRYIQDITLNHFPMLSD